VLAKTALTHDGKLCDAGGAAQEPPAKTAKLPAKAV
jgi:hypothetical protein